MKKLSILLLSGLFITGTAFAENKKSFQWSAYKTTEVTKIIMKEPFRLNSEFKKEMEEPELTTFCATENDAVTTYVDSLTKCEILNVDPTKNTLFLNMVCGENQVKLNLIKVSKNEIVGNEIISPNTSNFDFEATSLVTIKKQGPCKIEE